MDISLIKSNRLLVSELISPYLGQTGKAVVLCFVGVLGHLLLVVDSGTLVGQYDPV